MVMQYDSEWSALLNVTWTGQLCGMRQGLVCYVECARDWLGTG